MTCKPICSKISNSTCTSVRREVCHSRFKLNKVSSFSRFCAKLTFSEINLNQVFFLILHHNSTSLLNYSILQSFLRDFLNSFIIIIKYSFYVPFSWPLEWKWIYQNSHFLENRHQFPITYKVVFHYTVCKLKHSADIAAQCSVKSLSHKSCHFLPFCK